MNQNTFANIAAKRVFKLTFSDGDEITAQATTLSRAAAYQQVIFTINGQALEMLYRVTLVEETPVER